MGKERCICAEGVYGYFLPLKTDAIIEGVHLRHFNLHCSPRLGNLAGGGRDVDVEQDVGEQEEDPFGIGVKDQGVHAGSLSCLQVFEEPVAMTLLFDGACGGQGAADDGGEILAHRLIESQVFAFDQGVELVLHKEVEESSDR